MIVGGCRCGLHHEDVPTADVLFDLRHHLAIAELADRGLAQWHVQMRNDLGREFQVGIAGKDHHRISGAVGCDKNSLADDVASDFPVFLVE